MFIKQPLKDSTCIKSASYDEELLQLWVKFQGGQLYMYFNVQPYQIQELLDAASVGHDFYYGIRADNEYATI